MRGDVGAAMVRALRGAAHQAGCPIEITQSAWRRWASATFTGARHRITLAAPASDALDRWLGALAEAEFALSGHLVADLCVVAVRRADGRAEADLEILTLEGI